MTSWFNDLAHLGQVDWTMVGERYWADTSIDNDRQRRKQAEFLVHQALPWSLIHEIAVLTKSIARQLDALLDRHPHAHRPRVVVRPHWYYSEP